MCIDPGSFLTSKVTAGQEVKNEAHKRVRKDPRGFDHVFVSTFCVESVFHVG